MAAAMAYACSQATAVAMQDLLTRCANARSFNPLCQAWDWILTSAVTLASAAGLFNPQQEHIPESWETSLWLICIQFHSCLLNLYHVPGAGAGTREVNIAGLRAGEATASPAPVHPLGEILASQEIFFPMI